MHFLITGTAGFIGFHLAAKLLQRGDHVIGLDCVNDYYDVTLKEMRLKKLHEFENFHEVRAELENKSALEELRNSFEIDHVVHLAAQAGVRYSLTHPQAYVDSNITGFLNILELCRNCGGLGLTYASSSSVYGTNEKQPFSVEDPIDHPISFYAASKRANELMAHTYSHLFQIPTVGLRFFTVYGPWGRPDMALFLFADAILKGQPIKIFNNGQMVRDFTYIDDIVNGIIGVTKFQPKPMDDDVALHPGISRSAPYRIFNIGNNKPENLLKYIETLEQKLGKEAEKVYLPMQPGDVAATWADIDDLREVVGFAPAVSIEEGIASFVDWYKFYKDVA